MKNILCHAAGAVLAGTLFFTSALGYAQQTEKPIALDRAVRTGKLANGFTYYIRHNQQPKNRVTIYLANKVGSILESDEQQGLAHFMEHMNFNGTKHFPKNQLVDYLEKSGIRFGADINAYTAFDETVYQLPLPSDNPSVLKNGLQIMRDWAQEATLDIEEINKERGVVLEEERLKQGAQERMREKYFPVMLNGSRYANRIPIGKENIIKTFKGETIKRFYKDWYRPNLQALIVVGDIDVVKMEQQIKGLFSDLKNPAKMKARTKYTVPLTGKNQFISVTDPEMTGTSLQVLIKRKSADLKTFADYRTMIATQLYNQMMGNRFAELGRQANPPFLQAGAGIGELMGGLDNFSANLVAKPGGLEEGFKAMWREVNRIKRYGFTPSELERAKQAFLSNMQSALDEKDKTGSDAFVNEYLQHFLNQKAAPGIVKEFEIVQQQLPGISLSDMNQMSRDYLKDTNRDIIIMAPEKEKGNLPDETKMNGWIRAVEQETLIAQKEEQPQGDLLSREPAPGKITTKTFDKLTNTVSYVLSNGVKVLLKPTNFKNNEIQFSGFSPGGSSLYSDADFQSASSAAGLIAAGGVGNYNIDQLNRYMTGKQFSARPYISERFEGINGWSVNAELGSALQMIYAYFTQPRKDAVIFKNMIQKSREGLLNRSNDPNSVFNDTISAVLGNNNIRRTGPSLAKLDQISLDKSYEIYQQRFADAAGFTFVFTGSIDTVILKPLLEKYLAALPASHQQESAKNLGIHIPEGRIEKTVYKGLSDKATVMLIFSGEAGYSLQSRTELDALKEVLQVRLNERLREEEAGVYSPSVQTSFVKLPESRYNLVINFGCAPVNVEKLISSALDEVSKLRTTGPSAVNVEKFLAEDRLQYQTMLETNGFWSSYLPAQLQNGEPLDEIFGYEKVLKSISPEVIKAAASKYLSGGNLIRFVLYPENFKKN